MISEGTKLPSKATLVSIDDLVAQPQKYADQFIEVQGFNEGSFAIPACWPYYGPLDHWGLSTAPFNNNYERFIEIKGGFGGIVEDWGTIHNTMEKKAAVWGWWRLYGAGGGCMKVPSDVGKLIRKVPRYRRCQTQINKAGI